MSISNFVYASLHEAYQNLPTWALASGLSAGASYAANRFASHYITLPAPGVMFQFSATAYVSVNLWKAFQHEINREAFVFPSRTGQQDEKFPSDALQSHSTSEASPRGKTKFPASEETPSPVMQFITARASKDTLRKVTALSLGAYVINSKLNPESTLLSFVKLSVSAALSLFAVNELSKYI